MLKEEDLAAWFASLGITTPMSYDVLPDEAPTTVCAISVSGGLGLDLEETMDRPTFQLLTRGSNGMVARDTALALDEAFLNASPMTQIGGYTVAGKGRFGGPPGYVATDEMRRVLRSATYWLRIER